ncbi:radical SAM family heme chaperone HemW [Crocinitomicaceae bacterium]|nr:radical SAM family heme chaperone HemW [Crocinitomicaceae bacterium]MDC0257561.1 radical SAM family heme chaperone HemW [Crocinitomicaceae bacterium]
MAGIYIHIPFCKQQCSYCDFHFSTTFQKYRSRMLDAMSLELRGRSGYVQNEIIETIYFGGGTPSLLLKEELSAFLAQIEELFEVSPNAEISLEANPDDCTEKNLKAWKSIGVNRLSIGIQSFKSSDLEWMNRAHNAKEAEQCVLLAQSIGYENITVDLMYGLPGLSEEEWRNHIQKVIDWGVPHVSSYCLTVEENTLLERKVKSGELKVADNEEESRQFEILLETLSQNGIDQYEISNFSRPGFESRHNSNYWKGVHYLGIGPSAHSFQGTSRQWNIANNTQYMKNVEEGTAFFELEVLSDSDRFNELILTGLRTVYGVSFEQLSDIQQIPSDFKVNIEKFISQDWAEVKNERIFLTKEGRLRADFIASELFIA